MSAISGEKGVSTFAWWQSQRFRYNLILLVAAPVSVVCLFLVWLLFESRLPCLEITGFSLMFGAFLFVIGLGVANLCYFLGPVSERIFRPRSPATFRVWLFALGTLFSVLLIFLPVIGNLIAAVVGPSVINQCGDREA
jgi:TctA family transporter